MQIREADFSSLIRKYKNVLYLCHRNADPDALGSGFALQQAFGGDLGVVDGMDRIASSLVIATGAHPIVDPSPDYELIVVVDTSVNLQIGNFKLGKYALIDHHQDEGLLEGAEFYIQKPVDSTAEIVWRILKHSHIKKISRKVALGLLVGIITDTGRFKHAHTSSFQTVADILDKCDLEYADALDVLSTVPADISRRIAALKAANRADIDWIGDWIVVTSDVSAFEGSSAMTLVNIGADVAFVCGKHDDVCRVSGRARRNAILAGLDMAKILREVGRAYGGDGGGHPGAAGLEAKGLPKEILNECRKKVMEILSRR